MKRKVFKVVRGGWWPCEERVLSSLLKDNYPLHFIADVLGRDCRAVYAKIALLNRQETNLINERQAG
ncbi:hypothetical protein [Acinetobacter sp. BSP-53]|jgi:hypothetical protein|uniref:hypothetical protein n=1 Tax=Acinetobacter sp. BSP-53 TaxID=3344662 RepID=UPI00376FB897